MIIMMTYPDDKQRFVMVVESYVMGIKVSGFLYYTGDQFRTLNAWLHVIYAGMI